MTGLHEGKVAVVTGAARSMGQEIAIRLAEEGAKVIGLDLLQCTETAARITEMGGEFLGIKTELTSQEEIGRAHDQIAKTFGDVNVLVNVAGVIWAKSFQDTDIAFFRNVMAINLDTMFHTCKEFTPDMAKGNWGRVINFGSGIVHTSAPDYFAYRTSKGAVLALSRSLAIDLANDGITVNTVSPSMVKTPATIESGAVKNQDIITRTQVIHRPATPRDIVGLVSFLASEDAAFITGQMMHADGGLVFTD